MRIDGKALAVAFFATLALWAIAHALTSDQILQAIYIPGSNSIRVVPQ